MSDTKSILNSSFKESIAQKITRPLRGVLGGRKVTKADGSDLKKIYSTLERIGMGTILFTIGLPYTLVAGGILAVSAIKNRKVTPQKPQQPQKTSQKPQQEPQQPKKTSQKPQQEPQQEPQKPQQEPQKPDEPLSQPSDKPEEPLKSSSDLKAKVELAKKYLNDDFLFDPNKGFDLLNEASNEGSIEALLTLGDYYIDKPPLLDGAVSQANLAIGYYDNAADLGSKEALNKLAEIYREGTKYIMKCEDLSNIYEERASKIVEN